MTKSFFETVSLNKKSAKAFKKLNKSYNTAKRKKLNIEQEKFDVVSQQMRERAKNYRY